MVYLQISFKVQNWTSETKFTFFLAVRFGSAQEFTACSWVRATSNDWAGRNKFRKYAGCSVLLRRGFISWMNGEPLEKSSIRPRRKDTGAIIFLNRQKELEYNSVCDKSVFLERRDVRCQWRGHLQSNKCLLGLEKIITRRKHDRLHSIQTVDTFSGNSSNGIGCTSKHLNKSIKWEKKNNPIITKDPKITHRQLDHLLCLFLVQFIREHYGCKKRTKT